MEMERATISLHGQQVWLMGSSAIEQIPCSIDLCQQLRNTVFAKHWALEITLLGAQWHMQDDLSAGLGLAVSDGSFKEATRAAAWIIKGQLLET